jgi:hypothetical protein
MPSFDLFDQKLESPPTTGLTSDSEAHAKLKRNLTLALDVHKAAMSAELPDIPVSDKRLMVETAHVTVKAALATDRTALKARQDNTLELVFLRVLFHRKRLGYELAAGDAERLKTAPRAQLETALGARQLVEYDEMEF